MYGAVSSLLERVVPLQSEVHAPGAALDQFDIMGHSLPPGTVVGTQAWSMHRDPDVFPNPEFFDPERWLPGPLGNENKKEMERLARYVCLQSSPLCPSCASRQPSLPRRLCIPVPPPPRDHIVRTLSPER